MIQIDDEMRELIDNALANGTPCILATASPTGEPGVGLRGSMMVFNSDSLAYWERTKRAGLVSISRPTPKWWSCTATRSPGRPGNSTVKHCSTLTAPYGIR